MNIRKRAFLTKNTIAPVSVALLLCFYFANVDVMIPGFNAFLTIFISVILEAVPFLLIGTLISSIINSFVSPELIQKCLPKNKFVAVTCASFLGVIFPICECAIIPVATRLIKKGLPLHVAVTFLFAAPIVNPIVIVSTFYAFGGQTKFVILRLVLGVIISMFMGLAVSIYGRKKGDLLQSRSDNRSEHSHDTTQHADCCCEHETPQEKKPSLMERSMGIINHAKIEFFDVIGFFIMGAFISSIFNTYLPRSAIHIIGGNPLISIIVMMAFAYILSICSESDAFIARTFLHTFPPSSIVSFMVFGPMLDIKNTLMLVHYFKPRFVVFLAICLVLLNVAFALVVEMLL